jgi:signal transduction histidine kinase
MDRSVEDIIGRVVSHITLLLKPYRIVVTVKEGTQERDITDMYAHTIHGEGVYSIAGAPTEKVYESGEIFSITEEIGGFIHNDTGFLNENIKTYLGVPIKNSVGDVLGVVSVMEKEDREHDKGEVHLVEIFARYIGTILEQETISKQLRLSEKMKVFGQLAAGVAHEVRNPLNAIMAITEALAMDLGDHKEFGPFLGHIQTQVNRLSDLMRELLDLGKPIESSSFRRVSISDICSVTIDMWKQSTLSKKHKVTLMKPAVHNDMAIIGNSQQLQQVYFNLLENAAQHSPEESEIVLTILGPDGDHVITRVTDCGTGIPEEHISKVFEPFFTMRRKGTGMGLSLVQHYVEAHGGAVTVWNNASVPGCTFEVSLPLAGNDRS